MKTFISAIAVMAMFGTAAAAETCYDWFTAAAQGGVSTTEFEVFMEFETHKLLELPGEWAVIYNGYARDEGDILTVARITSSNGNEAIVTSNYIVRAGQVVSKTHCTDYIKSAL